MHFPNVGGPYAHAHDELDRLHNMQADYNTRRDDRGEVATFTTEARKVRTVLRGHTEDFNDPAN